MNIIKLYEDFNIDHVTDGHKHARPGWVNCECPFCAGNPGYHLGFNIDNGRVFVCYRCGNHSIPDTVSKLLNLPKKEAFKIIRQYEGHSIVKRPIIKLGNKRFKTPTNLMPLQPNHRLYLERRGFDPDYLAKVWGVQGLGPVSTLNKMVLNNRLFIPINWNGKLVSYQTRALSLNPKKEDVKYIACPKEREIIHHKHILYGNQKMWGKTGICVEGVTDVWKLGDFAFATLGIKFKMEQVQEIKKQFNRVVIIFDDEPQAQKQAEELSAYLEQFNISTIVEKIKGDPGSLKQDDANHLVKYVLSKFY
jgi:hypothetical protein